MITSLGTRQNLLAVSPMALSAYARAAGWTSTDKFGDHSEVYTGFGLPEIIVPRTQRLGDYPDVVARLVGVFSAVSGLDEYAVCADLLVADRDVVRVRVDDGALDGSIDIGTGSTLVSGARDMLLAAACSLHDPRPVYRAGANRDANEIVSRVRLGQTERGSFVVTMFSPAIAPALQNPLLEGFDVNDDPEERKVIRRLADALGAAHQATELTAAGHSDAFAGAVQVGASANLCEALAQMIEPFPDLDVSVTWARTRPMRVVRDVVRFSHAHASILREAARAFRNREAQLDVRLFGSVQRLKRDDAETDGTVTLRASIDGRTQSITAVLSSSDYNRAIEAHRARAPVVAEGDLDRFGQRWHLVNPRIVEIITEAFEDDASDDVPSME